MNKKLKNKVIEFSKLNYKNDSRSHKEKYDEFLSKREEIKSLDNDPENYTGKLIHSNQPEPPQKLTKWSIQLSRGMAQKLKDFCNLKGYKMYWFVEKAIEDAISGSYGK
jgi:hypothetical protein